MQADWIRFITTLSTGDQYGLAAVYDVDRMAVAVSMALDWNFTERKARVGLLDSDNLAV